jgi:hypothetical protein
MHTVRLRLVDNLITAVKILYSVVCSIDCILGSQPFDSLCSMKITLRSRLDQSAIHQILVKHFHLLDSRGILKIEYEAYED